MVQASNIATANHKFNNISRVSPQMLKYLYHIHESNIIVLLLNPLVCHSNTYGILHKNVCETDVTIRNTFLKQ